MVLNAWVLQPMIACSIPRHDGDVAAAVRSMSFHAVPSHQLLQLQAEMTAPIAFLGGQPSHAHMPFSH
jgi:hypothetical protein